MSEINATPPPFTVEVGDLDISELLGGGNLNIRQAAVTVSRIIIWEGSLTIAETSAWAGESLDNFTNPARWARNNHPVKLYFDGTLFATMRISGYTYDYKRKRATMQLSQLMGLLDYKVPSSDYRAIASGGGQISVGFLVENMLLNAGITDYSLAGLNTGGILPPDRVNKGFIALAQEALGERGYWLYHAPNEQVRVVRYNRNQAKAFERSEIQLIDFDRLPPRGITPSVYRVTGGGEIYQDNCSLASAIERTEDIYGDSVSQSGYWYKGEFVSTRTTIGRKIVEQIVTEVLTDEDSLIQVRKTGYKDLKLVDDVGNEETYPLRKTYEITDSRYYDRQGRLVRSERVKDGIAYANYPDTIYDLDPDALEWITNLETQTVEYSHDPSDFPSYSGVTTSRGFDTNVMRIKVETKNKKLLNTRPNRSGSGNTVYEFFNAPIERTVETWIEKCPNSEESTFLYQRKVFSRDPVYNYASKVPSLVRTTELFLVSSLSVEEDNATPPSWQKRPPLHPRVNAKLSVTATRNYPGSNLGTSEGRETTYSAKSITSTGEAITLASFIADTTVGRAFGSKVVMSLRDANEFVADPTPLQIMWAKDRVVMLDSASLLLTENYAEIAWEAISLRTLSPEVGAGSPAESEISPQQIDVPVTVDIRVSVRAEPFNAVDPPDMDLITVGSDGYVVTVDGFVQASENQNQFSQILVAADGSIVINGDGNVLTTGEDPYDEAVWNSILTANGRVLTAQGKVLTI